MLCHEYSLISCTLGSLNEKDCICHPEVKYVKFLTFDDCIEHSGKSFEMLTTRGKTSSTSTPAIVSMMAEMTIQYSELRQHFFACINCTVSGDRYKHRRDVCRCKESKD